MAQLWWLFLFIKITLVSFVPLTADENYYWVWSQKLSLSYFDHPPFVAWLFKLGSFLPEFMIKWPAVVMGHLGLFLWYHFLKNIGFNENQLRLWFWISIAAPLVGLSSMVLTPDLPLLFFYSGLIYFFERALSTKQFLFYIGFGLFLGLGFTAKYHIVLAIPCLLIFLLLSHSWKSVKWNYLPVIIFFVLLGALPVLFWNYQNDWASFKFQLAHGLQKKSWKPKWPWEYLGSVLIMILPIYWKTFYDSIKDFKQKLLISLSLPIFIFFMFTSFRSKVEANWSQIAMLPALSLIAYYDHSRWKSRFTLIFWGLFLSVLLVFWNQSWFKDCPEKLCEPKRYSALIEIIPQYQPFFSSNYQMASYLWFKTKNPVYKLFDMSRTDFFDTFKEAKPGANLFFVAKHLDSEFPDWVKSEGFKTEVVRNIDADLEIVKVYR